MPLPITLDIPGIEAFLAREFPQALETGSITRLDGESLELTLETTPRHLRPGGTVSGPTLMTLADSAAFFDILARLGEVVLAVTSSLEIHFLRKSQPGRVRATSRLIKLGRRLAVSQVEFHGEGTEKPIALATVTYVIP